MEGCMCHQIQKIDVQEAKWPSCIVEVPEHAIVRRRSVFSSFFAFFEIFRLANENQQTQNKSTFWVTRHADCPVACEASETKRSKGAKGGNKK